jgi:hypothetical protein
MGHATPHTTLFQWWAAPAPGMHHRLGPHTFIQVAVKVAMGTVEGWQGGRLRSSWCPLWSAFLCSLRSAGASAYGSSGAGREP